MSRKLFVGLLLIILFGALSYMIYGIVTSLKKQPPQSKYQNLPVELPLFQLDSTLFDLQINSNVIIVFYNSTCIHCLYQLEEITSYSGDLTDIEVLLMSPESITEIKIFSSMYHIANVNKVHFVKVRIEDVYRYWGNLTVPNIFIYNKSGALVKEFKGETEMNEIIYYAK